jgi:glycosyltransferase involved in cell wall biosynthesis
MPKVSVISIAKEENDFQILHEALKNQTFKDFELVTSTAGTIPKAWNDAISRATGDIFVFTESDAFPLNDHWLQEIVEHAKNGCVLKGIEINPTDLDLCNLVCDGSIFKETRFDESFRSSEDVELFARLRKMGVPIEFINAFPVVHIPSVSWRKTLSRGFRSGMYLSKILYLHGRSNVDDINTRNFKSKKINPISNRIRIIAENILLLAGLLIGTIGYLPILIKKRLRKKN